LIKLVWKAAGFDVVDLGNTAAPAMWFKEIAQRSLSVVGISCMTNRCLDTVRRLLGSFSEHNVNLPVIIIKILRHWPSRDWIQKERAA
jgi:methylmalonyl-CoA mutase cobalamin-binding subunit